MKPVLFLLCAVVVPSILLAQQLSHPVMQSRDDAFISTAQQRAFPDTVRVLAVMVQFQADTDPLTSGNGQFDLSVPAAADVEAPPHDVSYFQDHLTFLTNYYRKASGSKVVLQTTLVPMVFTLPALMSSYSPAKNATNEPVARLARDAWHMVDSSGLVPNLASYNCFVLFHAGVGRDVDLVGTLGYDPTPNDIPSLYLGLNAFRQFFGAGYAGIPVQGGALTNTIVVPETEFRMLPGVGGDVPLRLATNGLLCASVGNFLGLPDLFDTKTGASVLGRFGLMDGQSIFSFGGAFPPMPSAWERYYLGWTTVIDAPAGTSTMHLPAVSTADTIYRVAISPDEYFLVENRNRDPQANGQHVTLSYRGTPQTLAVRYDTAGFNADDITLLKGVVTDVEDLDWSTPGALDPDGTFYNGGSLIWHVDESVIRAGIDQDAVNVDPKHRGVDLQEADGSKDIGQQYDMLSPGAGSEAGTPLDFWFQGNLSPVFINEFSHTSHPSSDAYSGAESHITIRGFSPRGAQMQATAIRGDANVTPLAGFPLVVDSTYTHSWSVPFTVVDSGGVGSSAFFVTDPSDSGGIYGWNTEGGTTGFPHKASGLVVAGNATDRYWSPPTPVWLGTGTRSSSYNGFVVLRHNALDAFKFTDANNDSLADLAFSVPLRYAFDAVPWLPPVVSPDGASVLVPTVGGRIVRVGTDGAMLGTMDVTQDTLRDLCGFAFTSTGGIVATAVNSLIVRFDQLTSTAPAKRVDLQPRQSIRCPPVVTRTENGDVIAVVTSEGLYLLDSTLTPLPGYPVSVRLGNTWFPPVFADIDGDNRKDVVLVTGYDIRVYNTSGVLLDGFPVPIPTNDDRFECSPVVADLNGDGKVEIVAATTEGTVVAVDGNGRMIPGFPLTTGHAYQQSLGVARKAGAASALIVASYQKGITVSAWAISPGTNVSKPLFPWPQYQHDAWHRGYDDTQLGAPVPVASGFFPQQRAYNWPNPAYGGTTYLRYFVGQDATVKIKIYDLAGSLVKELTGPGVGGMDNEVAWDVSGVQSGIYFAHIKATGAAQTGETVVKVAVVK